MKGKVKFFNQTKGFGFIAAEDGKEYFVHQTGLKPNVSISENDEVTFDTEKGDKGPKAVNVALDSGEAKSPAEKTKKEAEEETDEEEFDEDE